MTESIHPLRISFNHRYLIRRDRTPFLAHREAAWSIIAALDVSEAELYLEDRRAKGFNGLDYAAR